jgi:hypothetical protein
LKSHEKRAYLSPDFIPRFRTGVTTGSPSIAKARPPAVCCHRFQLPLLQRNASVHYLRRGPRIKAAPSFLLPTAPLRLLFALNHLAERLR